MLQIEVGALSLRAKGCWIFVPVFVCSRRTDRGEDGEGSGRYENAPMIKRLERKEEIDLVDVLAKVMVLMVDGRSCGKLFLWPGCFRA